MLYNIDLAEQTNDPRLLKKLQKDIWELRTRYGGQQIRLFAFWDKAEKENTLVIATHGMIKKVSKVPKSEIEKALRIRKNYFDHKLMKKSELKSYSLSEMKNMYIGEVGTEERDKYEYELRMDILGKMIKTARQKRNLTQEQLGELIGVQKSQISKLENSTNSATIDTILKVFKALKAEINFNVVLEKESLKVV